jgi:hypothetical protein
VSAQNSVTVDQSCLDSGNVCGVQLQFSYIGCVEWWELSFRQTFQLPSSACTPATKLNYKFVWWSSSVYTGFLFYFIYKMTKRPHEDGLS